MKKFSLALFLFVSATFLIVFSACEKTNKKELVCSEINDMTVCGDHDGCKVVDNTCKETCSKLNAIDCAARDADCEVDGESCKDKVAETKEERATREAATAEAARLEQERLTEEARIAEAARLEKERLADEERLAQESRLKTKETEDKIIANLTKENCKNLTDDECSGIVIAAGKLICSLKEGACTAIGTPTLCKQFKNDKKKCNRQNKVCQFSDKGCLAKDPDRRCNLLNGKSQTECEQAGCVLEGQTCKAKS